VCFSKWFKKKATPGVTPTDQEQGIAVWKANGAQIHLLAQLATNSAVEPAAKTIDAMYAATVAGYKDETREIDLKISAEVAVCKALLSEGKDEEKSASIEKIRKLILERQAISN